MGRSSSGLLLGVKENISEGVTKIEGGDRFIVMKLSKQFFKTDKDIIMIASYLPPQNSNYYRNYRNDDPFEQLQQIITRSRAQMGEVHHIIMGDLNARLGTLLDYDENSSDIPISLNLFPCSMKIPRNTLDKTKNEFGKELRDILVGNDIRVLNGRSEKDKDGELTFLNENGEGGGSMVDLCCASTELFEKLVNFQVGSRIESDHMPIQVTLLVGQSSTEGLEKEDLRPKLSYRWREDRADEFYNGMERQENERTLLNEVLERGEVDEGLTLLNSLYYTAGKGMQVKQTGEKKNQKSKQPPYFDLDCQKLKQEVLKLLNKFRKKRTVNLLEQYLQKKKEFRKLKKQKEQEDNKSRVEELREIQGQDIWKHFKRKRVGGGLPKTIKSDEATNYFNVLLNPDITQSSPEERLRTLGSNIECTNCRYDNDEILNRPITETEIGEVVRKLPKNKASGSDGVPNEFIQATYPILADCITKLFNIIFCKGIIPMEWKKAIIFPIYKDGPKNEVGNYRGISLLCTMAKVFTSIMNKRKTSWMYLHGKNIEAQAGFTICTA